jgi:hypothetical protein
MSTNDAIANLLSFAGLVGSISMSLFLALYPKASRRILKCSLCVCVALCVVAFGAALYLLFGYQEVPLMSSKIMPIIIMVICVVVFGAALKWLLFGTIEIDKNAAPGNPEAPKYTTEGILIPNPTTLPPPAPALRKETLPEKVEDTLKEKIPATFAEVPPDITKAKQTLITSIKQFSPHINNEKLRDVSSPVVPGYFEFSADPAPTNPYSNPIVTTKLMVSTHFFASIRLATINNVQTMDFMGRDIWVVIDPGWNAFLVWETEQLQSTWIPIRGVQKDPILNTVAIYQKGRFVSIFVNNHYVGHYIKVIPPQPGPICVGFKANKMTGGKMFFRDFSIWDFENK